MIQEKFIWEILIKMKNMFLNHTYGGDVIY